jgi:exosortase/archaeosortase family protein
MRRQEFVLVAMVFVAGWPAVHWFFERVVLDPEGRTGLVPLMLAGILLIRDRRPGSPLPIGSTMLLLWLYLGCLLFCGQSIQAILILFALARILGGPLSLARSLAPFALAIFALPIARDIQYVGGYPMRVVTGDLAAALLRGCGYLVTRVETSLVWTDRLIEIDAPCSGTKMLWSGAVLALAGASFRRLRMRSLALLAPTTLLLVLCGNVTRSSLLFLCEAEIVEAPHGAHSAIGVACFALTAGLIALLTTRLPRDPSWQ